MTHQIAPTPAREDAWHRIGVDLDGVTTAAAAMSVAHLSGWDVRKTQLRTTANGATLEVPDTYATVRTHPTTGDPQVLGVVGAAYTPVQNEELIGFLDAVVTQSGARFEVAGTLRGGREVFVTAKLPETMRIGGVDDMDLYIAGFNSHDGSTPMRFAVTPLRVICANMQAAALRTAQSSWTIRHTSGATARVEQARAALDMTSAYLNSFETTAEHMLQTQLSEWAFMDVIKRLWPLEEDATKRQVLYAQDRAAELLQLYVEADTNAAIRDTAWAGYQAVVEYADHVARVRGTGDAATARAERTLSSDATRRLKERAFTEFALAA